MKFIDVDIIPPTNLSKSRWVYVISYTGDKNIKLLKASAGLLRLPTCKQDYYVVKEIWESKDSTTTGDIVAYEE